MLSSPYARPLLKALTGLIFSVGGLLVFTAVLLFIDVSDSTKPPVFDEGPVMSRLDVSNKAKKARPSGFEAGKRLFVNNCAQCHAVTEEIVVGPGLRGVSQRTPGVKWLRSWIRNSSAVIAEGEPYAMAVYNKFNRVQMTSFTQLTDQNISDILVYIDAANAQD